jgi:fibronectin type 3 domain-containing protein
MTVQPVPAPTGLATTPGDRQVSLTWNASPYTGVSAYKVYRAPSVGGPYTQIATATVGASPSYTDNGVLNGSTYYYQVSTWGPGANEGLKTAAVSAALPQKLGTLLVSVPASATVGQNFTVTVTARDDNNTTYTAPFAATMAATGGTGSLSPTTLAVSSGTGTGSFSYTAVGSIRVTAQSGSVVGTSAVVSIDPVPAPTGLVAAPGDHKATLTWNAVSSAYGFTAYKVFRASAPTGPYTEVASVATSTPSYADTSVANGATYYYQVATFGPYGADGTRSSTASAVLPQKLASLTISVPETATAGQSFTATVTARDESGALFTPSVVLTASADGTGTLTPTDGIAITGGSAQVQFTYGPDPATILINIYGIDPTYGGLQIVGTSTPIGILAP